MTYLLTRKARIAPGQTQKALEWTQNVTEKVASVSGLPVRVSQQVFSPEVGGISWMVFAPNLSTLEGLFDKIQQDDKTTQLIDQGAQFFAAQSGMSLGQSGQISDILSNVVHGDFAQHGGQQLRGGPEYQTITEAQILLGNIGSAMEVGVKIAQQVEKITGSPTLYAVDTTGSYNAVRWVSSHTDIRQMERAEQTLSENDAWQQFLDNEASSVYSDQPYATRTSIFRRLLT